MINFLQTFLWHKIPNYSKYNGIKLFHLMVSKHGQLSLWHYLNFMPFSFYLWHNSWHPEAPLAFVLNPEIVYNISQDVVHFYSHGADSWTSIGRRVNIPLKEES